MLTNEGSDCANVDKYLPPPLNCGGETYGLLISIFSAIVVVVAFVISIVKKVVDPSKLFCSPKNVLFFGLMTAKPAAVKSVAEDAGSEPLLTT